MQSHLVHNFAFCAHCRDCCCVCTCSVRGTVFSLPLTKPLFVSLVPTTKELHEYEDLYTHCTIHRKYVEGLPACTKFTGATGDVTAAGKVLNESCTANCSSTACGDAYRTIFTVRHTHAHTRTHTLSLSLWGARACGGDREATACVRIYERKRMLCTREKGRTLAPAHPLGPGCTLAPAHPLALGYALARVRPLAPGYTLARVCPLAPGYTLLTPGILTPRAPQSCKQLTPLRAACSAT